ncbi:MAG TPA: AcvB/VirJ family lysyl-phosphatidylglycerol hydrolase [Stellaceae bacterium]|nr:AcvB/VirJ family lysyl-phosphatidylglycerol hydrolase [Stellaceae bacterium]
MIRGCVLAALLVLAGVSVARADDADQLGDGRFGALHVVEPVGPVTGMVILFSDSAGWDATADAVAAALAKKGALVAGVDTAGYRRTLDGAGTGCHDLVTDAETTSRGLQRKRGYTTYHSPILAGLGEGGTLAAVILAQAPDATLAGAASLDPTVTIRTRQPLCAGAPPTPAPGGGFSYGAVPALPGFWTVGFTASAPPDRAAHIASLKAAGMPVDIVPVPAGAALAEALTTLVAPHLQAEAEGDSNVAGLPLIELPAAKPLPGGAPLLAIILSGDGGWRDLDKSIAEQLSQDGVNAIGWDSLRYFWGRKTPDQLAHDLHRVIATYAAKWRAQKVLLIGYSFGADVLPFAYGRLGAADRARVIQLSLLGFSKAADFEISMTGWLGGPPTAAALPVDPALAAIKPSLIQCFYGEEDGDDTACPSLAARGAEIIRTTGGHHFDGDYAALAKRILDGARRRAG